MALRLPAFCGRPTREEAEQVLEVSVARQQAFTATFTSLTKQRREVLTHPERLESLGENPHQGHVELLPSPKKRSNDEVSISIKRIDGKYDGPQFEVPDEPLAIEQYRATSPRKDSGDILSPKAGHWQNADLDALALDHPSP